MMKTPSLHDLYDPTSLIRLERSIAEGKIPNREELAAALEANSEQPLPPWFVSTVIKSLRGELKQRPGRPKASSLANTVGVGERKISAVSCMAAEPTALSRAGRLVSGAGERMVGWSIARTRRPNCYGAVAEAYELESVSECGLAS